MGLGQCDLVVTIFRYAKLDRSQPGIGKTRLHFHHGFGIRGGHGGFVAHQLEHIRHILDKFRTRFLRFVVLFCVVILVRQTCAALSRIRYYLRAVFEILTAAKAEDHANSGVVHCGDLIRYILGRFHFGDLFEDRL